MAGVRRALLWVVLGLAVAAVLYLVGANYFLRSEWGRKTLNRKPDKLAIEWESAWTWFPGVVHVRELSLDGHGRRADWRVDANRGRMVIWLPSLLRRHFRLVDGRAEGARVEVDTLPPPDTPRPVKRKRGWRVDLAGLALETLDEIRVNEYRVVGDGRVRGRARFEVRGPMEFDLKRMAFTEAEIWSGEELAARSLRIDGKLRVDPFVVGEDKMVDLLTGVTGAAELEAADANLGFVGAYLEQVPWLRVGGNGHLTADLEVTDGWMAPGSRIALEGPRVEADFFGFRAAGEGRVDGLVPEGASHTELGVQLDRFSVSRLSDAAEMMTGEGLVMTVTNDSNAVDRPASGVEAKVELPEAQVPDIKTLAPYVPAATEIELKGGSAVLAATMRYSMTEQSGDGRLRLDGDDVEAAYGDVDLRSDIALDARLGDARFEAGTVDLSGSTLNIERVRVLDRGGIRDSGWWGRMTLPRGRLVGDLIGEDREPAALDGRVEARLRDTGPLVALLEQRLPKLRWIDGILTVHDVEAEAHVFAQGRTMRFGELEITGGEKGRLELLGELDFKPRDPRGVLFARWGKLTAAVALEEGERDWKMIRSRRWYDRTARDYRAANPVASGGR